MAVVCYSVHFCVTTVEVCFGHSNECGVWFLNNAHQIVEEINPVIFAVAFDKGRQTFRTEMYSEYKGNRPDAPEDSRPQFSLIQDVLKALGICVIEEEGFEGDDILGSLSKKFGTPEMAVQIITGDLR